MEWSHFVEYYIPCVQESLPLLSELKPKPSNTDKIRNEAFILIYVVRFTVLTEVMILMFCIRVFIAGQLKAWWQFDTSAGQAQAAPALTVLSKPGHYQEFDSQYNYVMERFRWKSIAILPSNLCWSIDTKVHPGGGVLKGSKSDYLIYG